MSTAPRFTAYFVPHTHWDREWYLPYETFRARLVRVIDHLLDLLARDPSFPSFTLDGQATLLRDYLEVRPAREAELRRLIEAGHIRIGPWYVLADEFLVSPEALVRNLSLGTRTCAAFGDRLPVAYTPDSFGHVSQLPLLAEGFGLDAIVFERGVGDEGERLRGEFLWERADGGAAVFTKHLLTTYSSAAAIGHADWEMTDAYDPDLAVRHARAALYGSEGLDLDALPVWIRESLQRIEGGATAYATGDAVLLLNGSDHLYAQADAPRAIRDLNEALPEVEVRHADLEAFVRHARDSAGDLARHRGEFRAGRYHHLLSGVLSARMYLKQANARAQTRLEAYTEPLTALAWLHGEAYPAALLEHAWRLLLENHPHDSICGCSIDDVHDEMMTRFASVSHLAAPLEAGAERVLAGPEGAGAISVFNPHPRPVRRLVEATLPSSGTGVPRLQDASGRDVPCDVAMSHPYAPGRSDARQPQAHLAFSAELPPLGFASFDVVDGPPQDDPPTGPRSDAPPPVRTQQRQGVLQVENDRIRLEVGAQGGVVLSDLWSGIDYPLALRFEDDADAGDSYDFSPLDEETLTLHAPDGPAELIEAGPLHATVRLTYHAALPARLREDRRAREGSVPLPLTVELRVEADRPALGVRVALENRAEDHRLRLCVASGCRSDHVWCEGHFDLIRRPVRPPTGEGWFQAPQPTMPQRRFTAVTDGPRGLAVLNRGLPEIEPRTGEHGVELAVTLLRCVGWLSRDDLTSRPQGAGPALPVPGAQCPGRHAFELEVMPLPGEDWHAPLLHEADLFAAPPRARAVAGSAAAPTGMLELTAPLVMTACTRASARSSLLIRIWNPSPRRVEGALTPGVSFAEAHLVRLDETRLEPIARDGSAVPLALEPQEVRTIELVPDAKEVITRSEPARRP